ncbi:photosystem II cytochrome c-550 [Synechocystis sp. LKSZ1]|uniref:photosystem II cytochrome c-550 n=1 Tax=Synechocystis sp. LKSZ1 TaxID=3144951 RepID=UPI00336BE5AD
MKRLLLSVLVATCLFFQLSVGGANAVELTESTLTVPFDGAGKTATLNSQEFARGQKIFVDTCTQCHLQGKTKTNNNVSLGLSDLSKAEPPRDNLAAIVDYLKHPTSYDGEDDYTELHPNVTRPDIYPEMRNLTEDDLYDVAGYTLIAPKLDDRWGGTIYF